MLIKTHCRPGLVVALGTDLGYRIMTKGKTTRTKVHIYGGNLFYNKWHFSKGSLDSYQSDLQNKGSCGLEVPKLAYTYLAAAMNFRTYHFTLQSRKLNGHIPGMSAKLPKRMDIRMKYSIYKPSDFISILATLHNFQIVCDSNGIHEETAIWLHPYFLKERANAAQSYRISATVDSNSHREED